MTTGCIFGLAFLERTDYLQFYRRKAAEAEASEAAARVESGKSLFSDTLRKVRPLGTPAATAQPLNSTERHFFCCGLFALLCRHLAKGPGKGLAGTGAERVDDRTVH